MSTTLDFLKAPSSPSAAASAPEGPLLAPFEVSLATISASPLPLFPGLLRRFFPAPSCGCGSGSAPGTATRLFGFPPSRADAVSFSLAKLKWPPELLAPAAKQPSALCHHTQPGAIHARLADNPEFEDSL